MFSNLYMHCFLPLVSLSAITSAARFAASQPISEIITEVNYEHMLLHWMHAAGLCNLILNFNNLWYDCLSLTTKLNKLKNLMRLISSCSTIRVSFLTVGVNWQTIVACSIKVNHCKESESELGNSIILKHEGSALLINNIVTSSTSNVTTVSSCSESWKKTNVISIIGTIFRYRRPEKTPENTYDTEK